jgi:hypothetical protein
VRRAQRERSEGMKYVLVTGGVVSGLGKGITSSSIGLLLKEAGLTVTAIKIDPYLVRAAHVHVVFPSNRRTRAEHGRRHHVAVRARRGVRAGGRRRG